MSQSERESFNYFLSHRDEILVATLVGPMDSFAAGPLAKCAEEIGRFTGLKLIVLYFRDVPVVTGDVITVLTQMQMKLREGAAISICSLKPNLREKLVGMGVIREKELSDNLQASLISFKRK